MLGSASALVLVLVVVLVSVPAWEWATDWPQAELLDYPSAKKLRRSPTTLSIRPEQKPLPAGVLTVLTT